MRLTIKKYMFVFILLLFTSMSACADEYKTIVSVRVWSSPVINENNPSIIATLPKDYNVTSIEENKDTMWYKIKWWSKAENNNKVAFIPSLYLYPADADEELYNMYKDTYYSISRQYLKEYQDYSNLSYEYLQKRKYTDALEAETLAMNKAAIYASYSGDIIDNLSQYYVASYKKKGRIYAIAQNYDKAIKEYTRAMKYSPKDYELYSERGICYASLKLYNSAKKDFEKATTLTKTSTSYAVVKEMMHDLEARIKNPNYKSYYFN